MSGNNEIRAHVTGNELYGGASYKNVVVPVDEYLNPSKNQEARYLIDHVPRHLVDVETHCEGDNHAVTVYVYGKEAQLLQIKDGQASLIMPQDEEGSTRRIARIIFDAKRDHMDPNANRLIVVGPQRRMDEMVDDVEQLPNRAFESMVVTSILNFSFARRKTE